MGVLQDTYSNFPKVEDKYTIPINFDLTKEMPESHAWDSNNLEEKLPCMYKKNLCNNNNNKNNNLEGSVSIPMIDLNDPNVIEKIYNACEYWGFFQITNHGICNEILEKLETQAMKLFNLPMEEKLKVARSPSEAYGYGVSRIAPFFNKLMWSEGFTIMETSLIDHAKILWPNEYQEFCDTIEDYQAKMTELSGRVLDLLLRSLDIPESVLPWLKEDPKTRPAALQLNSYPKCPDADRAMGLAQHTDSLFFTIVHQTGNVRGLQVLKDGPGWVWIDPVPGALVVNTGDILHILSNGRYASMIHRAVPNKNTHRLSFAYFYGPPLDFVASPYLGYPGCDGPHYKSMTVKDYMTIKAHVLGDALATIKL